MGIETVTQPLNAETQPTTDSGGAWGSLLTSATGILGNLWEYNIRKEEAKAPKSTVTQTATASATSEGDQTMKTVKIVGTGVAVAGLLFAVVQSMRGGGGDGGSD